MNLIFQFLSLFLFLLELVLSRPVMQRIVINNHEWELPDEPGWEEIIKEAELVQENFFSKCTTLTECRQAVNELRAVFFRYPVSKKYLETNAKDVDDILASIFKWG